MRAVIGLSIAITAAIGAGAANARPAFYVGTGPGASVAQVNGYDGSRQLIGTTTPYDGFKGGVRVATGDVNGDGRSDLITGAGPGGGPHVRAFDGRTGAALQSFFAYDASFQGGVAVAAGDLDGDGRAEIVTGAGPGGGPHVKVFSGANGTIDRSFFAFDGGFLGGVDVATGDFGGDGQADLIVGAGAGGNGHVRIFDGATNALRASFFAFDPGFTGGVSVATGRFQGQSALFVGAGAGGAPRINIFNLADGQLVGSLLAFAPEFDGGVRLGFASLGGREMLLAATASRGGSVAMFDVGQRRAGALAGPAAADRVFTPFGPDYMDGLSIAGVVAAVPEPGSWALMIAGFGLVGGAARRRLRAARPSVSAA